MIFIAGCARSGTTLMQRLMRCFGGLRILEGEHPASVFEEFADLAPLVVKRNSNGWRELPSLHPSVGICYMVRHPYDVLTSYHPRTQSRGYHVTPERWINEYGAWQEIRERENVCVVRYEDLLQLPQEQLSRIAEAFGLEIARLDDMETLDTSRIGRWARDRAARTYLERLTDPILWTGIAQFCKEFGYE